MSPRRETDDSDLRAAEREQAKQERGDSPAPVQPPRVAETYVYGVHPESGRHVTFVPGEALPDWVELPDEPETGSL